MAVIELLFNKRELEASLPKANLRSERPDITTTLPVYQPFDLGFCCRGPKNLLLYEYKNCQYIKANDEYDFFLFGHYLL